MSTAFSTLPSNDLTPEQEQSLAKKIQEKQREADLNRLVMCNMREAVIYTRKCSREQIPDDELVSLCYTALMRNAKHFKPGHGMRFFGFAKPGLRGELSNYWKTLDNVRGANKHADPEVVDAIPLEEDAVDADFQAIFTKDNFKLVQQLIKRKTTPQEQMILNLSYQNHLNFQEIGKLLGVSRSAIQAAHARAIRKIRNEISRRKLVF